MSGKFLTCETRNSAMDVYVSRPQEEGVHPVVIVLMEAFGVNHHIRSVCQRLSQEGFVAAAPDLYHRQGRRIEVPYSSLREIQPLMAKLSNGDIVTDVRNCINFLQDLPGLDVRNVSTLGFCVGGFSAALCATRLNLSKMVCFYGAGMVRAREGIGLTPIVKDLAGIRCPCLFFFGAQDVSISADDIQELEKSLASGKVRYEVDVFTEADHGFFCDERKSYHPESAHHAWKKSLKFLRT